jgi:hypothetical protein
MGRLITRSRPAEQPHGLFYLLFGDSKGIFQITDVHGLGTMVLGNTGYSGSPQFPVFGYAPSRQVLNVYDEGDAPAFVRSTDGGRTYGAPIDMAVLEDDMWWGTYYPLVADLNYPDVAWIFAAHWGTNGAISAWVTDDGGVTWTQHSLGTAGATAQVFDVLCAAPRHNGSDAFGTFMVKTSSAPDVYEARVVLVDTAGNYTWYTVPQGDYAGGGAGDISEATIQAGATDVLYLLADDFTLYSLTWSTSTWALVEGPLNPVYGFLYENFVTTRAGVLLVAMAYWTNTLHVLRSTDAGVNWTDIDLGAYMPDEYYSQGQRIAIGYDDTLVIGLTDGTILYSEDDGSTWVQSPKFIPTAWPWIMDVAAAGAA